MLDPKAGGVIVVLAGIGLLLMVRSSPPHVRWDAFGLLVTGTGIAMLLAALSGGGAAP